MKKLLLATLAFLCALAAPAKAVTVSLPPVADTYVQYGTPTTNYGTATTMIVKNSGATDPMRRIGYLMFNFSSLPTGAIIQR